MPVPSDSVSHLILSHLLSRTIFISPAVPPDEEDMYDVTPYPDFEDAVKVQQYIQDRRVIGVGLLVF